MVLKYYYTVIVMALFILIMGIVTIAKTPIENIICTRNADGEDDFYIIDPNTGNVHDSSNLDYGKLLQSIHGGYEFYKALISASV